MNPAKCGATNAGGGGYGVCVLERGHEGSHLEGEWKSVNNATQE